MVVNGIFGLEFTTSQQTAPLLSAPPAEAIAVLHIARVSNYNNHRSRSAILRRSFTYFKEALK